MGNSTVNGLNMLLISKSLPEIEDDSKIDPEVFEAYSLLREAQKKAIELYTSKIDSFVLKVFQEYAIPTNSDGLRTGINKKVGDALMVLVNVIKEKIPLISDSYIAEKINRKRGTVRYYVSTYKIQQNYSEVKTIYNKIIPMWGEN